MDLKLDFRSARRSLLRHPGFAVTTCLTLALGIGVVTAMFSVVHGVLLRPLPIRDQDGVVLLTKGPPGDPAVMPFVYADLEALRETSRTLENVAGVQYDGAWPYAVEEGDTLTTIATAAVTSELFTVLGARPAAGRFFRPEDDAPRADAAVVIGHALWQRRYGGRPEVVGRTLDLMDSEGSLVIVGVAPRGFAYPKGAEMWMAMPRDPGLMEARVAPFSLVGRLAPGASPEQARDEVQAFLRNREETVFRPGEARGHRVAVAPFFEAVVGDLRTPLLVLAIAVGLLLLLVISNVANLFLVRAASRSSELAVRLAIGARRAHAARPLLFEGLLIALLSAGLGLLVAWGLLRSILALAPPDLTRLGAVALDLQALGFAVLLSLATALLAVTAPLLWLARSDLQHLIRTGAGGGLQTRTVRLGNQALVVWQAAMAMIVIAGAGLLGRTLWNLQSSDLGFVGEELVVANLHLPRERYDSPDERLRYYEGVIERLEALPRVTSATAVMVPPFTGEGGWNTGFMLEGQGSAEVAQNPTLNVEGTSAHHFETFGTPILRGRGFTSRDREGARPVAVVSRSLAERAWPGEDPLGRQIRLGAEGAGLPWRTVVGVAPDTRYRDLATPRPTVYVPFRQSHYTPRRLVVRTAGNEEERGAALSEVRSAVEQVDPGVRVVDLAPIPDLMREPLARPRFNLVLMALFAGVSLVLAAVGLYGVMALWVLQRSRELALRVALGARPGDIRRMVLRRGLSLVLAGVALSLVAVVLGGRVLSSLLYQVSARDPATLLAGAVLMLAVALVSCYRPVRRALRIDPALALSDASAGSPATAPPR